MTARPVGDRYPELESRFHRRASRARGGCHYVDTARRAL